MHELRPLIRTHAIQGFQVIASDGPAGRFLEFLFEDDSGVVAHAVVRLNASVGQRLVLVDPTLLCSPDWHARTIHVGMSREQLSRCPDSSTALPVARQIDRDVSRAIALDVLWPEGAWAQPWPAMYPDENTRSDDPHLRSTSALRGMNLTCIGGEPCGTVTDFLVDLERPRVTFMEVLQKSGRTVLAETKLIRIIDLTRREISLWVRYSELGTMTEFDPQHLAMVDAA